VSAIIPVVATICEISPLVMFVVRLFFKPETAWLISMPRDSLFLSLKIFFGGGATVREVRCSPTSQPFQKRDY
jgi:hypothetical protein